MHLLPPPDTGWRWGLKVLGPQRLGGVGPWMLPFLLEAPGGHVGGTGEASAISR